MGKALMPVDPFFFKKHTKYGKYGFRLGLGKRKKIDGCLAQREMSGWMAGRLGISYAKLLGIWLVV